MHLFLFPFHRHCDNSDAANTADIHWWGALWAPHSQLGHQCHIGQKPSLRVRPPLRLCTVQVSQLGLFGSSEDSAEEFTPFQGIFLTFWHSLRERRLAGPGPNHQAYQNQTIFSEWLSIECAWDYYCLPTLYWSWMCEAQSLFMATYKNERPLLLLKVNVVCLFNWMEMAFCFPNVIVNKFSRDSVWLVCRGRGEESGVAGGER